MPAEQVISDKKKALLAYKQKLLCDIRSYEKKIDNVRSGHIQAFYDDGESSDSDSGFPVPVELGPSIKQLKVDSSALSVRLQATQELTSLTVLESDVAILTAPPTLELGSAPATDGLWREVTAECRVDLVPFSIVFYVHQPNGQFAPYTYHDLKVTAVKAAHDKELSKSVLVGVTKPSDAVQVLRSYSAAHRARRTTLARLAEKYADTLFMEALPDGGYILKCANLLEISWTLVNKWSPIAPFHHKLKFDLEYMDEAYIRTIKQAHKHLMDPSLETNERTELLANIIDTCLEASGGISSIQESDFEPPISPINPKRAEKRRLTIDDGVEKKAKDSEVMAPPKVVPKRVKKSIDVVKNDEGREKSNKAVVKKVVDAKNVDKASKTVDKVVKSVDKVAKIQNLAAKPNENGLKSDDLVKKHSDTDLKKDKMETKRDNEVTKKELDAKSVDKVAKVQKSKTNEKGLKSGDVVKKSSDKDSNKDELSAKLDNGVAKSANAVKKTDDIAKKSNDLNKNKEFVAKEGKTSAKDVINKNTKVKQDQNVAKTVEKAKTDIKAQKTKENVNKAPKPNAPLKKIDAEEKQIEMSDRNDGENNKNIANKPVNKEKPLNTNNKDTKSNKDLKKGSAYDGTERLKKTIEEKGTEKVVPKAKSGDLIKKASNVKPNKVTETKKHISDNKVVQNKVVPTKMSKENDNATKNTKNNDKQANIVKTAKVVDKIISGNKTINIDNPKTVQSKQDIQKTSKVNTKIPLAQNVVKKGVLSGNTKKAVLPVKTKIPQKLGGNNEKGKNFQNPVRMSPRIVKNPAAKTGSMFAF